MSDGPLFSADRSGTKNAGIRRCIMSAKADPNPVLRFAIGSRINFEQERAEKLLSE